MTDLVTVSLIHVICLYLKIKNKKKKKNFGKKLWKMERWKISHKYYFLDFQQWNSTLLLTRREKLFYYWIIGK